MDKEVLKKSLIGGEFLINDIDSDSIFTIDDFNEEQRMMVEACEDFIKRDVDPVRDKVDDLEDGLMVSLLEKAGVLGLLGICVPSQYGGLDMSFNTSMLIADIVGSTGSFSTAYGAHTAIATLPILYYGTEDQKSKYLPKLVSGEWKGAYCLSEPDSGSDANAAKTRAKLSSDKKHYLINGQKMWITNGGISDLYIVFAKIDDDKNLSAFIVEKSFGGITMNDEEKKLGIKGSSTRQIFFNDCKVPVDNLLSERDNGFKIALNVLNIGRIKLGAGVLGGCRGIIDHVITYSNERVQFGKPISSFGAIKNKIAQMICKTYACEALSYRAGQDIDNKVLELMDNGLSKSKAEVNALDQFAIECAIAKVFGSEILDYVVDEGVQIYGGMGFSEEAPMARAYRDARISRIYEGTSEINRMLLVGMILKRAAKGELDITSSALSVSEELLSVPTLDNGDDGSIFNEYHQVIKNLKKATLMVLGKAALHFKDKISDEQEILMNIADMIINLYAAESVLLRSEKIIKKYNKDDKSIYFDITKSFLYDTCVNVSNSGKECLNNFVSSDELNMMIIGLRRFTKINPINIKDTRRRIADKVISAGEYNIFNIL
tara:strand:+ start:2534 stop:4342 length:1809 start_codon:yes stop_codon:yes gene_type:complete